MAKKKVVHTVMVKELLVDMWPGYEGERQWNIFVIHWPVVHPDTHCRYHEYRPDELGVCMGCGWVPNDAYCCEEHCVKIRYVVDLVTLMDLIETTKYGSAPEIFKAIYLAYTEKFSDKLTMTPDFDAVVEWFDSLKRKEKEKILDKHSIDGQVSVEINIISSGGMLSSLASSLDEVLDDLLNDMSELFKELSTEELEELLEKEDPPDSIVKIIKKVINEREEPEEEEEE